jgi:predicted AlkP superfamily pyrophosphatase or phosphodiesterase
MPAVRRKHLALLFFVGILLVGVVFGRQEHRTAQASEHAAPRLGVLVVFDQMRADYLERWRSLFGADGFRRLQEQGAWFRDCNYPYSDTVTGAGHATLATGCSPERHGIIGNVWYDRKARAEVYCAGLDRYAPVPPRKPDRKNPPGAPDHLLAPTLADALKKSTGGRGRVVSLSLKDRAAVLPGGRQPDVCCWFNTKTGLFETSTYYRDALPSWVTAFNQSGAARRSFGTEWTKLRPELDYGENSGPDDVVGEGDGINQGRTFPHPTGCIPLSIASGHDALLNSPFGNDLLLDLACRAIEAEKLGQKDSTDLLCISFSSNDIIGHCWGPDSQEVLDVTLRSDQLMARLLQFLDTKVGKGNYAMVVSADHGVCPLPEVSRRLGRDAGRIPQKLLLSKAEKFLAERFGGGLLDHWIEAVAEQWIYLDHDTIARQGLKQPDVEKALAGWLEEQPGMRAAFTRTQLLASDPADDLTQSVRRSFHPDRSGDVAILQKPYYLITTYPTGTLHGTPYPYDTHVPLLAYGPGVRRGPHDEQITPQAAAAILARLLHIRPPDQAKATTPADLLHGAD